MQKKTVIITSVGTQIGEGIIRSIGPRRDGLRIVGINSIVENPVNFQCDSTYLVPPTRDKNAFTKKLAQIVSSEKPSLIIPGSDHDILTLSELGAADPYVYRRLATGSRELCEIIRNKLKIYQFSRLNNLPFCLTLDLSEKEIETHASALIEDHGWPLLVKPNEGSGSQDVWIITDWFTLKQWFGKTGYILQPFLSSTPGLEIWLSSFRQGVPLHSSAPDTTQDVVQILLGPDTSVIGVFGMHTLMRAGRSWRVIPNNDRKLLALGRSFGEVLGRNGWRGPLNIQTRNHHGNHVPFEINGRFTGTTSARTELGFDEIRLSFKAFLDIDIGEKESGSADILDRRTNDYAISREQLSELQSNGVWHTKS